MNKILFVFRTARKKNYQNYITGLEPDHLLYGFNHFRSMGFDVKFSDVAFSRFNLLYWFFYPLQKLFIRLTTFGFKIDQAILLLPLMWESDTIISTADSAGLPILFLKRLGLVRKRIIYISTGFINELVSKNSIFINKCYKQLLGCADKIICHSEIEQKLYKEFLPAASITVIPFGIDNNFFKRQTLNNIKWTKDEYILSIGRDRSRDFMFLSKVARRLKNYKFYLVTSKSNIEGIRFSKNVKVFFDLPYMGVRELYRKSLLVLIPLKELNRASGQVSFLEAYASDQRIVISKVAGIFDVYKRITKSESVCCFKNGNINECVMCIDKLLKRKRMLHRNPYTSSVYAKALSKEVKLLLL